MEPVYVVAGTVKGYYHLMQYVEDITGHPQQTSIEKRLEIIQFFEKYGKEATEIAYKKKRSTIFLWKQNLKKAGGKLSALAPGDRAAYSAENGRLSATKRAACVVVIRLRQ